MVSLEVLRCSPGLKSPSLVTAAQHDDVGLAADEGGDEGEGLEVVLVVELTADHVQQPGLLQHGHQYWFTAASTGPPHNQPRTIHFPVFTMYWGIMLPTEPYVHSPHDLACNI